MKTSTSSQKKHRRNNRTAKTQRKTKKIKSIETKDDGDRDEYNRQQREHREGDINSNLNNTTATSESLSNLGANQADNIEMRMPSTSFQNQQQRTPEEEFAFPVMNRADPFGHIPAPHDNDV